MPFIASAIKNNPKARLNAFAGRTVINNEKSTAVITAGIITYKIPSVLKSPFFLCSGRANAAIGKNAIKFAACARRWSIPKISVKAGIITVPPPIPIPPKTPEIKPVTKIKINDIQPVTILIPAASIIPTNMISVIRTGILPRNLAPKIPPATLPSVAGIITFGFV